jgi:hypothetical protein
MTASERTNAQVPVVEQEEQVLKKYGLRWSVLAAWRDALKLRSVATPAEIDHTLEKARTELASGCFSACQIGCDLQTVERALTIADASTDHNWVDFWLDMLGHSMTDVAATEQLMKIPAIRFRYANCGIKSCFCD